MSSGDRVIELMMEADLDPLDLRSTDGDFDYPENCWNCGGTGYLGSDCDDDMCHGGDVPCLHGDTGEIRCDICEGEGGW